MENGSWSSLRRWALRPAAALVLLAAPGRAQDAAMHIPTARGTTLTGKDMALPNSLNGKIGVLVVGFSRASGEQVANWGRLIEAQYGQSRDLTYFEIPMLAGTPKFLRGMVVKQMSSTNGKIGVLVVGFSRASGEQVANWGRLIEAQYGQSRDLTY